MSPMPALQPTPDPEQEALGWFSRLRQPGCDEALRQAFASWCQDPLNARAYAQLEAYWQQLQVPAARPRPRVAKVRRSRAGLCLALLFLMLVAALAWIYWPLMQRLGSELHTDSGERRSVRLADGSTLHLDSASAMNVDLRGRTRQLHLVQGQVYLEVRLDGRAMEVQVDDTRIQVFGTRLQIARHAEYDELVVLSGKAAVLQGGDQRMVSAGERVTFSESRINPVEKIDAKLAVARSAGAPGRLPWPACLDDERTSSLSAGQRGLRPRPPGAEPRAPGRRSAIAPAQPARPLADRALRRPSGLSV